MNFSLIVIVFFIPFIISIYLFAYRNEVKEIMKRECEDYMNMSIVDLIRIYKVYRNNTAISKEERKLLKRYFYLSAFTVLIVIFWAYLVFGTDW